MNKDPVPSPGSIEKKYKFIAAGADSNVYLDYDNGLVYKVYFCNNLPGVDYNAALDQVTAYFYLVNQASKLELTQQVEFNGEPVICNIKVNPIKDINKPQEDSLNVPVTVSEYVSGYSFQDYMDTSIVFNNDNEANFAQMVRQNEQSVRNLLKNLSGIYAQSLMDPNINITAMNVKLLPHIDSGGNLISIEIIITDLKAQVVKPTPSTFI